MAKVLISDKISESAIQIFKNNKIEVDDKIKDNMVDSDEE